MAGRLFTFVQMEFPWELGPADGRYLLRRGGGLSEGEPQHVVVLGTVGAVRRAGLGRRRARTRPVQGGPASVAVARATVVDPVALSAEGQARAWLAELDPEREAGAAAGVLNRVLSAHRIATAQPDVQEVAPAQALVIRAGYGEGEQVADGLWTEARELLLAQRRSGRRVAAMRPQERLAALLSGREQALVCEELALRARADLDAGRLAHAAIELERALTAALAELAGSQHGDLERRVEELAALHPGVEQAAARALREGARAEPDETVVRHALERLQAALRARAAAGVL